LLFSLGGNGIHNRVPGEDTLLFFGTPQFVWKLVLSQQKNPVKLQLPFLLLHFFKLGTKDSR
jgi:hypothetical protein